MSKKTMTEQLRKTLRNEEAALDERFGRADAVMTRLEQEGTTLLASPVPPAPATAPKTRPPRAAKKVAKASASASTASDLVVREGFSMPRAEQAVLDQLQATLRQQGLYEVTRSQIVRAAIAMLGSVKPEQLLKTVEAIERRPPGRKVDTKTLALTDTPLTGNTP